MVTKTYLGAAVYNWFMSQASALGKFSPDLYRLELAAAVSIGIWGDIFFLLRVGMIFIVYVPY